MKEKVESKETMSPVWWLDCALMLNVLWPDLKELMTKYEMLYKAEVVALIEEGKKIGQANLIVESKSENYKMYCYLKGRDETVDSMIMISKKRATIEKFID